MKAKTIKIIIAVILYAAAAVGLVFTIIDAVHRGHLNTLYILAIAAVLCIAAGVLGTKNK